MRRENSRTIGATPAYQAESLLPLLRHVRRPLQLWREQARGIVGITAQETASIEGWALLGSLPPLYPEWLGDASFLAAHGLRFPYIAGEMAGGISSPALVIAMARAGMMGIFGAAGLTPAQVEAGLVEIESALGSRFPFGSNLIHSPADPMLEDEIAALYLRRGVLRVSASAFLDVTPAVVRLACSGLREGPDGEVRRARHLFAKLAHPRVARSFMSPAPPDLLAELRQRGQLSEDEARLAARVPIAEDITVEADSGGHTDRQPLAALLPLIAALRDEIAAQQGYRRPVRVGAAGGIGTPTAVAAAVALGAAYVVTGSINQAAREASTSAAVKEMLAQAGPGDTIMAPAADMFEMGASVQVLRRGTLFGPRAARLAELYQRHESLEAIPAAERERLEREIFRQPLSAVWDETQRYLAERWPAELSRAERDPRRRLALTLRWYLGLSSRWAIAGDTNRRIDYQIWCGPAMSAFNAWVAGSFLESLEERGVVPIALNLLEGAAVITRAQQLRSLGLDVPPKAFYFAPRRLS